MSLSFPEKQQLPARGGVPSGGAQVLPSAAAAPRSVQGPCSSGTGDLRPQATGSVAARASLGSPAHKSLTNTQAAYGGGVSGPRPRAVLKLPLLPPPQRCRRRYNLRLPNCRPPRRPCCGRAPAPAPPLTTDGFGRCPSGPVQPPLLQSPRSLLPRSSPQTARSLRLRPPTPVSAVSARVVGTPRLGDLGHVGHVGTRGDTLVTECLSHTRAGPGGRGRGPPCAPDPGRG